jgi:hypothetical protein
LKLDIFSHGIAISELQLPQDRIVLGRFLMPLVQHKLTKVRGRMVNVPDRTYAAALADRSEFRFHINQLDDLLQFLSRSGYKESSLEIVRHPIDLDDYPDIEHVWISPKTPRNFQPGIIDYVLSPGASKMVTLQTGQGKSFIAMWCAKQLRLRTLMTFKGGYADKWISDLEATFEMDPDELLMIRGSGGLIRFMDDVLDGTTQAKFLIITNKTMYNYLKDHEVTKGKSELYPIPANLFFQICGIGFHVKDEVHLDFHFNFRTELYTHTVKTLSLSATMVNSDPFMNKMYDIAYPVSGRNDGGGYLKYIKATALTYKLTLPKIYRYKGAQGGYSHNAFEGSMRSKKDFYPKYLEIFKLVCESYFVSVMQPGQKMLIFCASVEMCTLVQAYLQKCFPQLKIGRYTQEDKYSVLEESDISVSTVLSAGTAVDIPNLRITFMSTSINSRQSNEQSLGRTRVLVDYPDITPEFLYLVCEDIEKQLEYHHTKIEYFKNKVLSHGTVRLPIAV